MLFIGEQAVLIEIQKSENCYLIGDEIFSTLPTKVLNKTLTTANWNRALRYLNQQTTGFQHLGFFLIRFEIYLKDNLVVCWSKNSFEQRILDQVKFQNEFLPEIFAFRNRNSQSFPEKEFNKNFDWEIVHRFNFDFDNCWVSDVKQLQGHKYKVLFQKNSVFKVEKTKTGQVTYFSNFPFDDWEVVDLKNGLFYQKGKYQFNVEVCLTLVTEDEIKKTTFLNYLVAEIQKSEEIPDSEKNWHLFNITNHFQYLVTELEQIFASQSFEQGLNALENLFKALQKSYFSILLTQKETKNVFLQFARSENDKARLTKLINRYGILDFQEQQELKF